MSELWLCILSYNQMSGVWGDAGSEKQNCDLMGIRITSKCQSKERNQRELFLVIILIMCLITNGDIDLDIKF